MADLVPVIHAIISFLALSYILITDILRFYIENTAFCQILFLLYYSNFSAVSFIHLYTNDQHILNIFAILFIDILPVAYRIMHIPFLDCFFRLFFYLLLRNYIHIPYTNIFDLILVLCFLRIFCFCILCILS